MEMQELLALIDSIGRGRSEDNNLEWKRQWWDFSRPDAKDEMRKDVAALANSCSSEGGHLIVGVKGSRTFPAPLPRDEAELQEIIKEIMPPPNVRFTSFEVDLQGERKVISLISVLPPFDRPYVTQQGAFNIVFVRRGSNIGTATRFDLDTFYRQPTASPNLKAEWEFWPSRSIPVEKGTKGTVLLIPPPRIRLEDLAAELEDRLANHEVQSRETGYPTRALLDKLRAEMPDFLQSLESRDNLVHWYFTRISISSYGVPFSVVVNNKGAKPATGVKISVSLPTWLYMFKEKPERPKGYVPEPFISPPPKADSGIGAHQGKRAGVRPFDDFLRIPPIIPQREPHDGSWIDSDHNSVTFWADRILHAHSYRIENPVRVVALPTAPAAELSEEVDLWIFCEEATEWARQSLTVHLVGPG